MKIIVLGQEVPEYTELFIFENEKTKKKPRIPVFVLVIIRLL